MATISLIVVIKGPEATAGSILHFLKIIGIKVPTKLDTIIDVNILIPTASEVFKMMLLPRFLWVRYKKAKTKS